MESKILNLIFEIFLASVLRAFFVRYLVNYFPCTKTDDPPGIYPSEMTLIQEVKKICDRLAPHGWRDLLLQHGLDIAATDLKRELTKELPGINRRIPGFEDFAQEGKRGIEPRNPARSLLFHAFASTNVVSGVDGKQLSAFPTLAEIDTVENYVYGVNPPSLLEIRARANRANLAIVVFASEYRPAPETVLQKHAEMCYSRTGIARVGTVEPLYNGRSRGFLPFVDGNPHAFRVLPARYSAYLAVQMKGNKDRFGPMRFNIRQELNRIDSDNYPNPGDDKLRDFWVPLHKLFNGKECLRGFDLQVVLKSYHINEKLRRIHLAIGPQGTGWQEPDISKPPFIFTEGIAEWSNNPQYGPGVLLPVVHPHLVQPAEYKGKPLTFKVPKDYKQILSSSLNIPTGKQDARRAPEYVHARFQILPNGQQVDLNEKENVAQIVAQGGYDALHFIDFTGDGWIEAICPQLAVLLPRRVPAYSIVAAPDFFPNTDQRELMDWWQQSVPSSIKRSTWRITPGTLSDERLPPNIQIKKAPFRTEDTTVTAIVSFLLDKPVRQMPLEVPETNRSSYLPDAAAGIFAPGWDVSFDVTPDGTKHLAAYGLGSPFPEDAKLCAALSTFWPAVAPDTARTFEPNEIWPTISPLTDEEIGQIGKLPWDGVTGPRLVNRENKEFVEYAAFDNIDYVKNALQNQFSLSLTGKVGIREYEARVLAMARVYRALGIQEENFYKPGVTSSQAFWDITNEKAKWSVFSFRKVADDDPEVKKAESQTKTNLHGNVYRFQVYRHGDKNSVGQKVFVAIEEMVILFVDPIQIVMKRGNRDWELKNI